MKIILYCPGLVKGGTERVLTNLANELDNDKFDVTIITNILHEPEYKLNRNIKCKSLDNKKVNSFYRKLRKFSITRQIRLKKIIQEERPDIILAFLPESCFRVLFLRRKIKNIPIIISERAYPPKEYKLFGKVLMKILYNKADGCVFQTEDVKKYFPRDIIDRSVVIPNPINTKFVKQRFEGEREKVIVNIGRLTNQKNQQLLIDTFEKFVKIFPDYTLKIYGEGKLHRKLQNSIYKKNLLDKVILKGNVDNIEDEIYKSAMFVLTSNYEGMPNALMEAMSLGLPSISTDCPVGGPKYLIENNINGMIVPTNDSKALFKAMEKIATDIEFERKLSIESNKIGKELEPKKIYLLWKEYILRCIEIKEKYEI